MAGPTSATGASGYRPRNSTADKALDILLMFDEDHLVISAPDVAAHLGVARSTAYRYLQSLVSSRFLESDEDVGFRLGSRILEVARLARRGMGLSRIARPVMKRLADDVGEAVLLTRRAGDAVICIEREDVDSRAVRISYERGQVLPVNAGASAHALLAWLPDAELDALLEHTALRRFTDQTLTDKDELRRRLAETRGRGYALSRGELDPDVLAISAPLRDPDGPVVATLTVAAVSARVPDDRVPALVTAVCAAADEINASLALFS